MIAKDELAYTKTSSVKLLYQGHYVDVVTAYNQITFVKSTLQSARDDINSINARMYNAAVRISTKVRPLFVEY